MNLSWRSEQLTREEKHAALQGKLHGFHCPLDGSVLETWWLDADGYSMFRCPLCDCAYHADAFVSEKR